LVFHRRPISRWLEELAHEGSRSPAGVEERGAVREKKVLSSGAKTTLKGLNKMCY